MANPELKIVYRATAILGSVIVLAVISGYIYLRWKAPQLFIFSGMEEKIIELSVDSIPDGVFIQGLKGCENIYLERNSQKVLVTTLAGTIWELDGERRSNMKVVGKTERGTMAFGIAMNDEGLWYAGAKGTRDEWISKGGYLMYSGLGERNATNIFGPIPGINGLDSDPPGDLYLAFSNNDYLKPKGGILKVRKTDDGYQADTLLKWPGIVNGIFFDSLKRELLFTSSLQGAFLCHENGSVDTLYFKTRFLEAFDDLCRDENGNLWMADPGNSSVKLLKQGSGEIVRFKISGLGQISSCRIRKENGVEILYLSELKRKQAVRSVDFDGRGLFSCPVRSLMSAIAEPKNNNR